MSTAVLPQPKAAAAVQPPLKPHRWSIAEYRELDKSGLFYDCKTMLLNGEVYVMPLPSPPHVTAAAKVENHLRRLFPNNPHVRVVKAFDIGARNDPGPDVAVVPGTVDDYAEKHPTSAVLIVEIAVSSLSTDLTTKVELYATARVPDYWVLDVEGRELHVFRDPEAQPAGRGVNAYRSRQTLGANDSIAPLAAPTAMLSVADLLPKPATS